MVNVKKVKADVVELDANWEHNHHCLMYREFRYASEMTDDEIEHLLEVGMQAWNECDVPVTEIGSIISSLVGTFDFEPHKVTVDDILQHLDVY